MSTDALNILIGFGGVFLLGVIGFIIAWFSPPDRRDNPPASDAAVRKPR